MYVTKKNRILMRNNDGFYYKEVFESKRNWNDTSGLYLNFCKECDRHFFGNKYRHVCRECYAHPGHFSEDGKYFNN